jgi:hypothetical protein
VDFLPVGGVGFFGHLAVSPWFPALGALPGMGVKLMRA